MSTKPPFLRVGDRLINPSCVAKAELRQLARHRTYKLFDAAGREIAEVRADLFEAAVEIVTGGVE